jgi:hypothetical protein
VLSGNSFNTGYSTLTLGRWLKRDSTLAYFEGAMDEVKLIGAGLTPEKIAQLSKDTNPIRYDGLCGQRAMGEFIRLRPTARAIRINVGGNTIHHISLYSASGRVVKDIKGVGRKSYMIDNRTMAPGVYMLRVKNGSKRLVQSVVLAR